MLLPDSTKALPKPILTNLHSVFKIRSETCNFQTDFSDSCGISCEIALIWMSLNLTEDQSTLVQVMAWCRQTPSHYLSQCWARSLSPYGITRPQWVKLLCHRFASFWCHFIIFHDCNIYTASRLSLYHVYILNCMFNNSEYIFTIDIIYQHCIHVTHTIAGFTNCSMCC